MGIHNSSSLSLEQRVANPKKNTKNNMKAFTTACALIGASASADSQFYTAPRLHGAGVIPQTVVPVYGPYAAATTAYTTGAAASVVPTVGYVAPAVAAIRPATVTVTHSAPAVTGVAHQTTLVGVQHHVVPGPVIVGAPGLIKREADAEADAGEFQYQTKVENPEDQSKYEYSVKVDHKGNGKSYQYHEQKNEDKMSDVYNLDDDHMDGMVPYKQDHHQRNMMEQHRQRNMMEQHRQRNMVEQHRQRNMMDQHRQRNMVNSNQMMEQQHHQQRNMVDIDQHHQRNMIDNMDQHRHRNMVNQDQMRMRMMDQQNQRQLFDKMMNQQQEQDMLNTLMEQRQDNNIMREYMMKKLRDSSRMNNMYTFGRMHQRNNNMERHMSNMEQHRQGLGKREAEPSFEYDVVAEHDANRDMHNNRQMLQNNQQMMTLRKNPQQEMLNTIMLRPAQQTYRMTQMDDNMESRMNQMNFLQASQQDNRMPGNSMNNQ